MSGFDPSLDRTNLPRSTKLLQSIVSELERLTTLHRNIGFAISVVAISLGIAVAFGSRS
jgi:hypothetical protein